MINEHCKWEFYKAYKKQGLKLKIRRCCRAFWHPTRIEYYPNYGVRLSCMCGESCLTIKRAMHPEIKTEEEFIKWVVERWNAGQNDAW